MSETKTAVKPALTKAARRAERGVDTSDVVKAKIGRPLKFQSAKVLKKAIDDYFVKCDVGKEVQVASAGRVVKVLEPQPYTITGLCNVLGIERDTLLDYGSGMYDATDNFSDTVKEAKAKVLEQIERNLYNGKAAAGAIFSLKNNNGWRDRTEQELSGAVGTYTVQTVNYSGAADELDGGELKM